MENSSGVKYWKTIEERYPIGYSFQFDSADCHAQIRVFIHEKVNGDERKIGEMILILRRDRWAGLRGIKSELASEELNRVVNDENCKSARHFLNEAEERLQDFVKECAKSREVITRRLSI